MPKDNKLGTCPDCGIGNLQYECEGNQVNLRVIECDTCSYTKETDTKQADIIHH